MFCEVEIGKFSEYDIFFFFSILKALKLGSPVVGGKFMFRKSSKGRASYFYMLQRYVFLV